MASQLYLKNSVPSAQFRASNFSRRLLSQATPVKKESAITIRRIAYAVKLVRFPFLLVAISSIGYQRGGELTLWLFLTSTSSQPSHYIFNIDSLLI